jgi:hypothetical protein
MTIGLALALCMLVLAGSLLLVYIILKIIFRKRLLNYISLRDWDQEQKDNGYEPEGDIWEKFY